MAQIHNLISNLALQWLNHMQPACLANELGMLTTLWAGTTHCSPLATFMAVQQCLAVRAALKETSMALQMVNNCACPVTSGQQVCTNTVYSICRRQQTFVAITRTHQTRMQSHAFSGKQLHSRTL